MRAVFGRSGACRTWKAVVLTLVITLGLLPANARGQTPTPDATLRAYRIVEKQVREWAVPEESDVPAADAPKAVGACVTLKLRGKVVGRGQAWSSVLAGPDAATAAVVPRAIRAAMQQAEPEMGVPNDAMREAAIKLVAPDVLISVELAGPMSVVEFDTWEDAELTLRPGLDGVAVRVEPAGGTPGVLHAIFPGQMMLSNMLPHRGLGAMAAIAMGEGGAAAALDDPKKLREKSGLRMYRFRVGQVAENSEAVAVPLYRGSRFPTLQVPTRDELVELGRRAAGRLLQGDRMETTAGAPGAMSELLAAYSVARFAACVPAAGISLTAETPLIVRARQLERDQPGPGVPAMGMLALLAGAPQSPPPGKGRSLYPARFLVGSTWAFAPQELGDQATPAAESVENFDPKKTPVPLQPLLVQAVAAYQLRHGTQPNHSILQGAESVIRTLFANTPEPSLPTLMPWLGWAELDLAQADHAPASPAPDVASAIALRHMREECWKHQLSMTDAGEDAMDMVGGIVFTSGVASGRGNPYPTWQCVRPLAFMATMLRDPRLTDPPERTEQIVRLMQAARFLRQLQVDESSAWMYPDPKLAIGGIRASTWDNSLPVDATSMTLLFTVELIKSLDELSAAKSAEHPAAPVPAK